LVFGAWNLIRRGQGEGRNVKLAVIGDPHGDLEKIQRIPLDGVDLVLMTGDLGRADILRKIAFKYIGASPNRFARGSPESDSFQQAFLDSYTTAVKLVQHVAQHCQVFTVTGNADLTNYDIRKLSAQFGIDLPLLYDELKRIRNVRLIDNRLALFHGLRIGGIKYFTDISWAEEFELAGIPKIRERALRETAKAGNILVRFGRLDILVTHVPPYGILDTVDSNIARPEWRGRHAGSKAVLQYIKRYQPGYVFCGHIHEAEGTEKIGQTTVYNLGKAGHWINHV
jgi:Icc-related predicted phosphoesterase